MRIFVKLSRISNVVKVIWRYSFISSFTTSSTKFSKFDAENKILGQINVSCRNIKENTLARYFIKITAHPRFTQL